MDNQPHETISCFVRRLGTNGLPTNGQIEMLRALVTIEPRGEGTDVLKVIEHEDMDELAQLVFSYAILCHASSPKADIKVKFENPPPEKKGEKHDLKIKCLQHGCQTIDVKMETQCSPAMVGALTLVFHAAHEGHRLSLTYAGETWDSPKPF